jgi:ribosome maturation factor RimP
VTLKPVEKKIWDMIAPDIEAMDLRLVRVQLSGSEFKSLLQIMIEPLECTAQNRVSVHVDECASVSRTVSVILDVEDPISTAYELEVSSTGVERPLVLKEDFDMYKGDRIKTALVEAVDGRKTFFGILEGLDGDTITVTEEGKGDKISFDYTNVHKAQVALSKEQFANLMKPLTEKGNK